VSASPDDCVHLGIDVVREIHAEVIKQFGGANGVRDENLLTSTVLTPQSSFGGKSPYADIVEIAAAYLFYICKNHPFLDGNKRTAMMAAIVFLRLNDVEPAPIALSGKDSCSMSPRVRLHVTIQLAVFANCSKNPEKAEL
jgi:death-on-curing protein